jgi:hypothetical protein
MALAAPGCLSLAFGLFLKVAFPSRQQSRQSAAYGGIGLAAVAKDHPLRFLLLDPLPILESALLPQKSWGFNEILDMI